MDTASTNPGGSPQPLEPNEQEVWIERVSSGHCYIRLGESKNLATVLFPSDSEEAEVVRGAFERLFASRANDGVLQSNKEK